MAKKGEPRQWKIINRVPVRTLWAAVVAECLSFDYDESLTLGRAVAGFNAYTKGVMLSLFQPTPKKLKERRQRIAGRRR